MGVFKLTQKGERIQTTLNNAETILTPNEIPDHLASRSNPHNVTAEQVNAYTKDESDILLEKKLDSEGAVLKSDLDVNHTTLKNVSRITTSNGVVIDTQDTHAGIDLSGDLRLQTHNIYSQDSYFLSSTTETLYVGQNSDHPIYILQGRITGLADIGDSSADSQAVNKKYVDEKTSVLEERIEELEYVPIAIASMTVSPNTVERGSAVSSSTITWKFNEKSVVADQYIDGVQKDTTIRSFVDTSSYTSDKKWTLTATDKKNHRVTSSATLKFLFRAYWGAAMAPSEINSDFILSLERSELASGKARTINVDATSSKYIWYAIPSSFGTPTFTVGGFAGGISLVKTFMHTNASGASEQYNIYRSDNSGLGQTTVVIS